MRRYRPTDHGTATELCGDTAPPPTPETPSGDTVGDTAGDTAGDPVGDTIGDTVGDTVGDTPSCSVVATEDNN